MEHLKVITKAGGAVLGVIILGTLVRKFALDKEKTIDNFTVNQTDSNTCIRFVCDDSSYVESPPSTRGLLAS
jgi:hypothetical protein